MEKKINRILNPSHLFLVLRSVGQTRCQAARCFGKREHVGKETLASGVSAVLCTELSKSIKALKVQGGWFYFQVYYETNLGVTPSETRFNVMTTLK